MMINDFLDNLAADQYQKMHKEKTPVERLHDDIRKDRETNKKDLNLPK